MMILITLVVLQIKVIDHYHDQRNSNKLMIESDFKLFKNEVTIDSTNTQQD